MYRIRYSERLMIFTSDIKENELSNMSFGNLNEMAERLKVIAKTNSEEKNYVDIYMPVSLLQVYTLKNKLSWYLLIIFQNTDHSLLL